MYSCMYVCTYVCIYIYIYIYIMEASATSAPGRSEPEPLGSAGEACYYNSMYSKQLYTMTLYVYNKLLYCIPILRWSRSAPPGPPGQLLLVVLKTDRTYIYIYIYIYIIIMAIYIIYIYIYMYMYI